MQICTERDDVLLTAAGGQCIRFPVTDVRVFTGRTSMGVRGIALAENDTLISLAILRHVEATSDERSAYLKMRRAVAGETAAEEPVDAEGEETSGRDPAALRERYVEMSAQEQVVLTVSVNGYGKRTSSYEYRTTGRGGKGIVAMSVNNRNGKLVASFPVEDSDQIMLVTDKGQLIRCRSRTSASPAARRRASSCSIPPRTSTWCRSSISATTAKTATAAPSRIRVWRAVGKGNGRHGVRLPSPKTDLRPPDDPEGAIRFLQNQPNPSPAKRRKQ